MLKSKFLPLLILILVFSFFGGCGGEDYSYPVYNNDKVDWVVMVYIAADNSLSSAVFSDISEMQNANLTGTKVRVVVLVDQAGDDNSYLYEIINGDKVQLGCEALGLKHTGNGEVDTGSTTTLANFIDFTKINYPADNYNLILWNHGGGWRSVDSKTTTKSVNTTKSIIPTKITAPTQISKAICWDENGSTVSYLGNNDVQTVVTSRGISLLSMDACLMGMLETAYEMRYEVTGIDYFVGSQNIEPGGGYQYTTLLDSFVNATDLSSSNFGWLTVAAYAGLYDEDDTTTTQSAIDLSKVSAVVTALDAFVTYLNGQSIATIATARTTCETFADVSYIDLWDFANKFTDGSVTTLQDALDAAVIYNFSGPAKPNAHGLSINFPTKYHETAYSGANNSYNIDLLDDSTWDDIIQNNSFELTLDSHEPADDTPGGYIIAHGNNESAFIIHPFDFDYYSFTVTSIGTIIVDLTSIPAGCDYDLGLYDNSGNPLAVSANSGSVNESITYNITQTGAYHILVAPYNSFSLIDSYQIAFSGTATY